MSEPRCETCLYCVKCDWLYDNPVWCVRFPPTRNDPGNARWPILQRPDMSWCGEHREREPDRMDVSQR